MKSDFLNNYSRCENISKRNKYIIIGIVAALGLLLIIIFAAVFAPRRSSSEISAAYRVGCLIEESEAENKCKQKGCIWNAVTNGSSCYLPKNYGYARISHIKTSVSRQISSLKRNLKTTMFGGDIDEINFLYEEIDDNILHFKFYDPKNERYEVPIKDKWEIPIGPARSPRYQIKFKDEDAFSFEIIRKNTQTILWDTSIGGLTFADKFLQIATKLPSKYVYGFGENRHNSFNHDLNYNTWPMFARDEGVRQGYLGNHYGVHPFYTCMENDGKSHGVLFLNSNSMDYTFQPAPALILKTIGGVLDFYMFLGPTPGNVIQQYTKMIGRSFIPPYWGLGFQISRWGYDTLGNMKQVVERNIKANIPFDVQVGDLDYMEAKKDFTYDKNKFANFPDFITGLHDKGMRLIIILDPAIVINDTSYETHQRALMKDVYIKWPPSNVPTDTDVQIMKNSMLGWVWPDGKTAFPDWFKSSTQDWWKDEIKRFYETIKFDGLWIDMNEPANFGTNEEIPWFCNTNCWSLKCPTSEWDDPPYPTYAAIYNNGRLSAKTLCMTAMLMEGKLRHYDVHNLYGWSQAPITLKGAQDATKERSLVISRSTYPGTGKHAGHWLGDNISEWPEMHHSIIGMLEFNLFGIPYIGADICGFFQNTTEELCTRWQQLGAFYPFSRNHNTKGPIDQDPAVWSEKSINSMRKALEIRYFLLPYLYTLFFNAHTRGDTVIRPLFHEFPNDKTTYTIDRQFLWGQVLMIAPVLEKNKVNVDVYFPNATWYDYYKGTQIDITRSLHHVIDAPIDHIPLFVRGGFILPAQKSSTTVSSSRQNPFTLIISLNHDDETGDAIAEGELFWDDGQSIDTYENKIYNYYRFHFKKNQLDITLEKSTGPDMSKLHINLIKFYGVSDKPNYIIYNNNILTFTYGRESKTLELNVLLPMNDSHSIYFRNDIIDKSTLDRFDCAPNKNDDKNDCQNRDCIWTPEKIKNIPQCYYKNSGYIVKNIENKTSDIHYLYDINLERTRKNDFFSSSKDLENVRVSVHYYTDYYVRIKFYTDAKRYVPPEDFIHPFELKIRDYVYHVDMNQPGEDFSLSITRLNTSRIIWKTIGGLVLNDQLLELTIQLPSNNVYGLGENTHQSLRHDLNFKSWGMFSRDQPPGGEGNNLYGVHPFYMCVEPDGLVHGVFLYNSNAMEYKFTPKPSLTLRSLGGVMDFFIFLGPTPDTIISDYSGIIGHAYFPPYWALGFQLSHYGYNSLHEMKKVLSRTEIANISVDAIYGDIDYLDERKLFTYNKVNFKGLPTYINELKTKGVHFVSILNPVLIANEPDYEPYKKLNEINAFIQWPNGTNMLGKVWPNGPVAFMDFLHPNISSVLGDVMDKYYQEIPYSGLWLDMNEPANFAIDGSEDSILQCPKNTFEDPPYKPKSILGSRLSEKTVCMSGVHYPKISHYNVHSIYGRMQQETIHRIIFQNFKKRLLVVSRSTYPGSGRYGGHWLGDNDSSWKSMRESIIGCLEFNMFGIPFVGADICGYFGDATEELCERWMQLGAFYTFSRNHNGLNNKDQDPATFGPEVALSMKQVLDIRYTLLPYLFSEFFSHSIKRTPVMRSLFMEFPTDKNTWGIDDQFMFGEAIMVVPVLEKGKVTVSAYFPNARWFDYRTGEEIFDSGRTITVDAPRDIIPLFILGGNIIPTQKPDQNTMLSTKNPYSLIIAPNEEEEADGILYYVDGGELISLESGSNYHARFSYKKIHLEFIVNNQYKFMNNLTLDEIIIFGISKEPTNISMKISNITVASKFNPITKVLFITNLYHPMNEDLKLDFVYS